MRQVGQAAGRRGSGRYSRSCRQERCQGGGAKAEGAAAEEMAAGYRLSVLLKEIHRTFLNLLKA